MTANADRASFPPAGGSSRPGPEVFGRVFSLAATALAELQDEARERLPTADLMRRVVVTATAPRVARS